MRKLPNLSKVTIVFILIVVAITFIVIITTFTFKGNYMKNISYKSENVIIQTLVKANKDTSDKKTLIVLGNGWNVSVNQDDEVTEHDPFFLIPLTETKLLKQDNCEIITAYFPFECQGLNQAGLELAEFINEYYDGYEVVLIGHSKSGVCFANLSKWLRADGEDVTIVTVSAPYGGVKSDEENLQKLNQIQKWIYPKIIVPHRTNDDITINSEFLMEIADFSGLDTRNFYNIRSFLPETTYNPLMLVFKWLDNKFQIGGDGMVGVEEQKAPVEPKKEFIIRASHQSSMIDAIKRLKKEGIL